MKSMLPQTCEPSGGEQWVDCKVGGLDHWDWFINALIIRSMVVYPGLEVEHNCLFCVYLNESTDVSTHARHTQRLLSSTTPTTHVHVHVHTNDYL